MANDKCQTPRGETRMFNGECLMLNARPRMPDACHGVAGRRRAERRTPYGVTTSGSVGGHGRAAKAEWQVA